MTVAAHEPGGEIHIAGVLVQVRPLMLGALHGRIDALGGAEVFQTHADGRMVVVVEGGCTAAVLDTVDAIRALAGVLNVALVYQHAEPLSAMQQEIQG